MLRRLHAILAVLMVVFGSAILAACTQGGFQQGNPETAALVAEPYRLDTGDKLRITVFAEENLSNELTVSDSGDLALPLIGNVHAAGKTVSELQNEITKDYASGYVNEPSVSIEVLNYRPYFILGEVNKPGQYAYASNLTVPNAVATAAGFTYRADTSRIYIRHANEVSERAYPLTASIPVQPGDTIRVTERFF